MGWFVWREGRLLAGGNPSMKTFFLRLLLWCATVTGVLATELPPGEVLVPQERLTATRDPSRLTVDSTEGGVWRIRVGDTANDPWLAQLKAPLKADVKKGERGLFILRARAVETSHESSQGQFRLVVADREKPFPRIATGQYSLDAEWREIALPFVFERDYAGGRIDVFVDLGYGRQTVELEQVRVMRFGPEVELATLPRTRPTYAGHEPDAPWRVEALARIERIRKGELSLVVTDAAGRAVPGARVHAELESHAFGFGTVVNVDVLSKVSPDTERYRAKVLELFNAASFENAFKWANWEGDGKPADYRERTLRELAWLNENKIEVRGHVMVWPGWRFLPEDIKALKDTPEKIPAKVSAHIRDIALVTKGQVTEWDVLNEPVSNHDLMDLSGREIMVDWFKEAAAVLPGVPLFLNDWGNHDARVNPGTVAAFEEVAGYLREHGAPLGGLGLQCHIGGLLNAPQDVLATIDGYQKKFGLPVRITEFDVNVDDEEIQADYTRDFMIAMFSHPSVVGVQQWGFWEGRHWQPKAALYRKDWTEKPNGAAYRKLVCETWHTDESGMTDERGAWSVRGFYGRYAVTVTVDGKVYRTTAQHLAGGGPVTVVLPADF
jgi:endo-1,4-beta-xylanase